MLSDEQYLKQCQQVREHNRRYYVQNNPSISDKDYDELFSQLVEYERAFPEKKEFDSPTQRVGSDLLDGFENKAHKTPMYSLANTYSLEEVEDFIKRVGKDVLEDDLVFCVELKIDGLAISVTYEKGRLIQALTRGDGISGDDVTQNVKTIRTLPLKLETPNPPDYLELRGEVYMPKETFNKLNEQREEEGLAPWANPRNAAAGSLKLLDSKQTAKRGLDCFLYGFGSGDLELVTQKQVHEQIEKLGLPFLKHQRVCYSLADLKAFFEQIESMRPSLPFEIDGVVIKLNSLQAQQKLGFTGKNPRWAIAYKFSAPQVQTCIKAIEIQVGRTGVLTPVAHLTPVFLDGSTISRASLHNAQEIARKDIRIHDQVLIEKGGDVIPKVVQVLLHERQQSSEPWKMPTHCPSCNSPVYQLEGEVAFRCQNPICPQKKMRQLSFFTGKQGADIEHLGEKIVETLYENGLVASIADFYRLDESKLATLDGFKEKSITRLLKSIDNSKKMSLSCFLKALGIRYVGAQTAQLIAKEFVCLENLYDIDPDRLIKINGIGDKVAKEVLAFFSCQEHKQMIQELVSLGIELKEQASIKIENPHFKEKRFVLTGTLARYSREQATKLIRERGGEVSSSLSKKTDYLLTGENPGSKLDKAQKLGVELLKEEKFHELLQD